MSKIDKINEGLKIRSLYTNGLISAREARDWADSLGIYITGVSA